MCISVNYPVMRHDTQFH